MNIHDVARRSKVSSGTVSRVLNDHDNIDQELRRRVLHAVAELGYLPRRARRHPGSRPVTAVAMGFFLIQERRARSLPGLLLGPDPGGRGTRGQEARRQRYLPARSSPTRWPV